MNITTDKNYKTILTTEEGEIVLAKNHIELVRLVSTLEQLRLHIQHTNKQPVGDATSVPE